MTRRLVSLILIFSIILPMCVVFTQKAFAPTGPVISSVSPITATQLQTIYIQGSGFGNTWPQTISLGDGSVDTIVTGTTPVLGIGNNGIDPDAWAAGVWNDSVVFCAIGLRLVIWSDTEIVLGGFGSALNTNGQGPWNIATGDPLDIAVFTTSGEAHYKITVVPVLSASASAIPTSGIAPLTVQFTGWASGGSPPYSYSWNFGDSLSFYNEQNPSHTYESPATYSATLTVTDAIGNVGMSSVKVVVTPASCSLTITSGNGGIVFYDSSSSYGTISSGQSININVPPGAQVSLSAIPDTQHAFQDWSTSGAVSVSSSSTQPFAGSLTVNGNGGVTASFSDEEIKGVCSTISLNWYLSHSNSALEDTAFSIQQNLKIPLKQDSYGNLVDYYWVQNVVYVFLPGGVSGNYGPGHMSGGFQLWRYWETNGAWQTKLVDCYPKYLGGVQPALGGLRSSVTLASEIEGNDLVMANDFCSHTFTLQNDQNVELYFGIYPYSGSGHTNTEKTPEIVIVSYGVEALGTTPILGELNVDFTQTSYGIKGSVDDSFLPKGSTSWVGAHNVQVIPYGGATCLETSTGLKWDTSQNTLETNDDCATTDKAQEGFWFTPVLDTCHSPPNVLPSSSKAIIATIQCPAYLNLYDSLGDHTGFNTATGRMEFGIPDVVLASNGSIVLLNPSDIYRLTVVGTANGMFRIEVYFQDTIGGVTSLWDSNETITQGSSRSWVLSQTTGGAYVVGEHDVAVTSVVAVVSHCSSKVENDLWVFQERQVCVNVTVLNRGDFDENASVTLYYNITSNEMISTQNITILTGENRTLAFLWNTKGVPYCQNYTLTAVVTIPLDNSPADNSLDCGPINVRIMGDINGDRKVDGKDIALEGLSFGTCGPDYLYPGSPAYPRWNLDCDTNCDNRIDGKDLTLTALNFGKA